MTVHYSFLFIAAGFGVVVGLLIAGSVWRSDYNRLLENYQTLLKRYQRGW
jgi:hypothetical protein